MHAHIHYYHRGVNRLTNEKHQLGWLQSSCYFPYLLIWYLESFFPGSVSVLTFSHLPGPSRITNKCGPSQSTDGNVSSRSQFFAVGLVVSPLWSRDAAKQAVCQDTDARKDAEVVPRVWCWTSLWYMDMWLTEMLCVWTLPWPLRVQDLCVSTGTSGTGGWNLQRSWEELKKTRSQSPLFSNSSFQSKPPHSSTCPSPDESF